jgi:valine--pyruvate aminotransferase
MRYSNFGRKFTAGCGIIQLMDDLGDALAEGKGNTLMLGGGNPSHIPEMQEYFRQKMNRILENNDEFESIIGNYDSPQGEKAFVQILADLFRDQFGWNISAKNIALTNGSQTAFFYLFNLFAGDYGNGKSKKILFPLAPEYIGYADIGLSDNFFTARKPEIDFLDDHIFKYKINFDSLNIGDDIGAICVSRPTNPTGNVLTDEEISKLDKLAKANDIPLIIDNAYGTPFPHIIFTEVKPIWDDHIILCMSLSKLGLPGTRTGIIIAAEPVIEAISGLNAILGLAPGSFGAALAYDMIASGDITRLSREIITPYYQKKSQHAVDLLSRELDGCDFHIHKPEGALFLWLWLKDCPVSSEEMYQRLKKRGVIVVPGHYFFPGLEEDWKHKHECMRITYAQNESMVEKGLKIIADEAKKAYAGK